jgi:hypothetical protein
MSDVLPAKLTKLIPLQTIRIVLLVFAGRIIPLLADRTGQVDDVSHVVSRKACPVKRRETAASTLATPDA